MDTLYCILTLFEIHSNVKFLFLQFRDLNTLIVVIKLLELANHINYVNFNLKKIIFTKKP